MDLSKLREVCRRYSAPRYFAECIPDEMEIAARARLRIDSSETIVALIDKTGFLSGNREIVLTDAGLYWGHPVLDSAPPNHLTWAQLRERSILEKQNTPKSKSIEVGDQEVLLYGAKELNDPDNHLVKNLLVELIALSEASSSVPGGPTPETDKGFAECEYCRGNVKRDVTYCKHCGMKLRG